MGVVVGEVADQQTGVERIRGGGPEDEHEQGQECQPQRDAQGGRHHQPHAVVGVVVVDPVDDEVEPVAVAELRLPVKQQTVQPVLGQRPEQQTARDEQRYLQRRIRRPARARSSRRSPGRRRPRERRVDGRRSRGTGCRTAAATPRAGSWSSRHGVILETFRGSGHPLAVAEANGAKKQRFARKRTCGPGTPWQDGRR